MIKILKKNYDIHTGQVNKRIILLTDIHYYQPKDIKKLNKILKVLEQDYFDYICLSGDIIDVGHIKDISLFINWLKSLAKLSKVFISLGGHDIVGEVKRQEYYYNEDLFDQIKSLNNVYLLDNTCYVDEGIRFIGLTLPLDYYFKYKENVNYFKRFVNNTFDSFNDKYNILLSHTPIPFTELNNYDGIKLMKNIPLVLSGHTHAGIVPAFLRDKLKGQGIFSPHQRGMFPKDCYGEINRGKTKIIISSGVTKASHTNPFSFTDCFFDKEITYINLKK